MKLPNIAKAAGLGVVVLAFSAGAALAAVAVTSVNVRSGPGTSFKTVDTLFPGEPVAITHRSGGWCAVDKVGADGWVACRYLAWGAFPTVKVPGVNVRLRAPRISPWWGFNPGGINISIN